MVQAAPWRTHAGGFWSFDSVRKRFSGDAITRRYLAWPEDSADSVPLEVVLEGIAIEDRDRIEEALSLAVASRSYYDQTLSMMTRRGWRRIQTIGYWQPTPYGGCTHLAGWFVDVSDGLAPYDFNIDVAVHYIHLAQRAARAGGHNLANYLLEDVLIELEDVQKRNGPNIIRLTLDPDRDTA